MNKRGICLLNACKKHPDCRNLEWRRGFTIVELLVVIVVIGILATITISTFGGVTQRATIASLQSDLSNASKQLKLFVAEYGTYPATIDCTQPNSTTNTCVRFSADTVSNYSVDNIYNPQNFCIHSMKGGQAYRIKDNTNSTSGDCLDYGLVMRLDAGYVSSYLGSGTAWNDLSGNSSNATMYNGVAYSADGGGSMAFDGVNDYVGIPYASQFNIRNSITLSIWMKRTSVFSQLQDNFYLGRPPAWYFYDAYNSGNIHGDIFIDGVRRAQLETAVPFDGKWYQVIYTYNSSTKVARIYKNGVQSNTTTLSALSNYLIDSSAANFANMGNNTLGRTVNLNDARVYNRELSAGEVSWMYESLKAKYGL